MALIALLAILRRLLILDLAARDAGQVLALGSAIVALGGVYWLVRDQDRRQRDWRQLRMPGSIALNRALMGINSDRQEPGASERSPFRSVHPTAAGCSRAEEIGGARARATA